MSKVVVTEFVSVDGVMEDPGGSEGTTHGGWTFQFNRGPEGDAYKYQELVDARAHLLGRVTYQGFAAGWPTMEGTGRFGERMNGLPKYVASTTLTDAEATWAGTTVLRDDMPAQVAQLKAEPGGDLLVAGSGTLARNLMDHGLVDEFHLMVFPVVLGRGARLFSAEQDGQALARRRHPAGRRRPRADLPLGLGQKPFTHSR
jgi:dihydrofolate reductase